MGILEIHFHDSEFVFRPSMRVGPSPEGDDGDEVTEADEGGNELRFPNDEEDRRSLPFVGAVLLLVVVGLVIRALRDRTES